ncbi:hypothetical protein CKM354_000453600 [Cercospora kikuchii]|uniref:Uncharacterized protein n=1 Tax=Cercospora kikuchii TaxID=84275 RepID=A0A9P3FBK7_9PEZI|nr:uncharacterized protein CKM354_000453600 [Cercospora kikuchii]GIZ41223.1 hypothetical protein CKM354_000453600 [Cercospora kikuchii]
MLLSKKISQSLALLMLLSAVPIHASNSPASGWADKDVTPSLQSIPGGQFIGDPVAAEPLRPKTKYNPSVLAYHRDSGNSRIDDYFGPLGKNVTIASTTNIKPAPLFWDDEGRLTAGAICNDTTSCIVALNPETFDILATWTGPTDQGSKLFFPFFTYSTMYEGRYITPVMGPRIIEVQRSDTEEGTSFSLAKEWDLSDLVGEGNQIINSAYDEDGNLWFSTGGFPGAGVGSTNTSAVIGYFDASGTIRHLVLPDASIENGVAMTGTTVYLNAAPAGANDHPNATGHLYALQPSADGVRILYNETYDAGSGMKPGGISRGSGSSPTLLGTEYVAITDNAHTQIRLNFFKQATSGPNLTSSPLKSDESVSNLVCSVPVFRPNASASENTLLSHFDGTIYSAVISGSFGAPPVINFFNSSTTLNDPAQFVTTAKPGLVRVDFDPRNKSCRVRWEVDLPMTGNPTLSTATGLLYHYHQDVELAKNGEYVWYLSAIDWQSGEVACFGTGWGCELIPGYGSED